MLLPSPPPWQRRQALMPRHQPCCTLLSGSHLAYTIRAVDSNLLTEGGFQGTPERETGQQTGQAGEDPSAVRM